MKEPQIPSNEAQRVAALKDLGILDSPPEQRFNRITRTASLLFGVPIALVSLVDTNRQWFKSRFGLYASETPRSVSFCGHAILEDTVFVVEDALEDERFRDNPLVTGPPHVRFYAGKPLHGPDALRLGTLCVIDSKPRKFGDRDRMILSDLAAWAEREINLDAQQFSFQVRLKALLQSASDALLIVDAEGAVETLNEAAGKLFGSDTHALVGRRIVELLPGPGGGQDFLAAIRALSPRTARQSLDWTLRGEGGGSVALRAVCSDFYDRGQRMFAIELRRA